ncbi:hypothetical protein RIF29_00651 [Crotalaria pallida]|uniref:Membrane protein of ER body-like protein n=1 Tax=Crotalaria pallida TaxID=3830 RepID=A0AAN9IW17_CROPI
MAEVVENQWKEAENEVEEAGLQRKRSLQPTRSFTSDSDTQGGSLELDQSKIKEDIGLIATEVNNEIFQSEEAKETITLPASDYPIPRDPTSLNIGTTKTGIVSIIKENGQERQELYLERVYEKPPTHGFYCPNCKSCIQKVYIQKGEWEQTSAPAQLPLEPADTIRCSSCFSFLIPIGSWLFPGLVSDEDGALNHQVNLSVTSSSNNNRPPEPTLKGALQDKAPDQPDQSVDVTQSIAKDSSNPAVNSADDSENQTPPIVQAAVVLLGPGAQKVANEIEEKINSSGPVASKKKHFWNNWAVIGGESGASIPKQIATDSSKNSEWKVIMPTASQTTNTGPSEQAAIDESTPLLTSSVVVQEPGFSNTLEILKSIVYGGLTESLASLSVVTSAASADATTLNIVALAIANLIGGLFALVHNLRELKAEQPKRAENHQTDAPIDRYKEVLGQRKNFYLHAFISIISFIVFGLVPPVVYGFSFRESGNKDFKLAALGGASLLCITLLSIAKAYIQRPNSYLVYFQTVFYYVSTSAVASVLSYLAGDLVKKFLEEFPWLQPASNFGLQVGGMNVQKPGWRTN